MEETSARKVAASSASQARNRASARHNAGYGTLVSVQQANAAAMASVPSSVLLYRSAEPESSAALIGVGWLAMVRSWLAPLGAAGRTERERMQISTSQGAERCYRLIDGGCEPHRELDAQYSSLDDPIADAIAWVEAITESNHPAALIGVEVSTTKGGWRSCRHLTHWRLLSLWKRAQLAAAHSSSALPRGINLICLRPSLISNSSPGLRSSMAV